MVINIRPAFTQSYINILSKVSVLTSLAVQWLGLHAFTARVRFDLWLGNYIPNAKTKSSLAKTKDPTRIFTPLQGWNILQAATKT